MENEKNDRPMHRKARKKVCHFCVDRVEAIDYKDVARLRKFISERAKILPRRATGTCAAHQRGWRNHSSWNQPTSSLALMAAEAASGV